MEYVDGQTLWNSFRSLAPEIDAAILMDQVDVANTGVVTGDFLESIRVTIGARPDLVLIGDSRRSLKQWPAVWLKMNASELAVLTGMIPNAGVDEVKTAAAQLAQTHGRPVFVTLAEGGIVGADELGEVEHVPAFPTRGEIDIVGAGDAVTANLTVAFAAGAELREALELAMAAASIVIHQLGTTGTATVSDIEKLSIKS